MDKMNEQKLIAERSKKFTYVSIIITLQKQWELREKPTEP